MFGRWVEKAKQRLMGEISPVDLDVLIAALGTASAFWPTLPSKETLACARLADYCRDNEIRPVLPSVFRREWDAMAEPQQLRFCLFVSGLEVKSVSGQFQGCCQTGGGAEAVLGLFCEVAASLNLLTLDLLRQSDIRLEEFARHYCAALALPIAGEAPESSQRRLQEIDFSRLMKEAELARASAEDRLIYLRKLQEEQETTRRARRGKW